MPPSYTGLEDSGNYQDKVEGKMYICPFGMDSPLIPWGHLGQKEFNICPSSKGSFWEGTLFPPCI